ncbi:hypothetical protein [Azospirillum palustre]
MFPPRLPVLCSSSARTGERTKKAPPRPAACWGFIASARTPGVIGGGVPDAVSRPVRSQVV